MILQVILAAVLLARKTWKTFPIFFSYSIGCLVLSATLYTLRFSPKQYVKGYWIAEMITLTLGFGVIYEIFNKIFTSYKALRTAANVFFQWAFVVLIVLGCVVLYYQSSTERNALMGAMLVVEEATRTIEVGLLLVLFLFVSAFGLHWRQSLFGIALGFGLFISTELIAVTARLLHFNYSFIILRGIAFNISLLLWLSYLLRRDSATVKTDLPKLAQLEQWNQALMELIHQ